MLKGQLNKNVKRFRTQIITIATLLSLMILVVEVVILRGSISPWILIPLALGVCLIDHSFEILLMTAGLLKDRHSSGSRVLLRLLQFMPALLSVSILARLCALVGSTVMPGRWGSLFPALC